MPRLTIRIDFEGDAAFGPGKARLLESIAQTGSLRRAAAAMAMSYRRAWLLLRDIEAMTKSPVVAARTGGPRGGGTALTPFAQAIVARYRAIEARAARAVAEDLRVMSAMTKPVSTPRPAGASRPRKVTRAKPRKQG